MRIYAKLLILLLIIALLPLVLLSLRGQRATENLGLAIADRGRAMVSGEVEGQLQQSIGYASDIMAAQQRQVELALNLQVAATAQRLQSPAPEGDLPLYRAEAFATPATWPPGTELALDHVLSSAGRDVKAVPISRQHQAFYIAKSADADDTVPPAMADEMRRLSGMDAVYSNLAATVPGLFYWQYVALPDGLMSVFPGHGGFPASFDPRARAWYVNAVQAGALTWSRPYLDASTRRLLLTATSPVRDSGGQLLGVAGIDVNILEQMNAIQSRLRLGANTVSYIVRAGHSDGRAALRVLASSSYTDTGAAWDAEIDEPVLPAADGADMDEMIRDLQAGRTGLRHMRRDGVDAVWIYGPISSLDAALIYIVPAANVTAVADEARQSIWSATTQQTRLAGIASLGLMVVVIIISLFAARSVTQPLRQLAAVARGLAAGKLDTRADIDSNDEVGDLAQAFNAMVPELQNHIKVKEGLVVAREVQQKLLPAAAPVLPGYDIAGESIYSEDVGGDYYDFLEMTDAGGASRVGVVIGDVAGHGVGAALTMTAVRVLMRSYAGDGADLLPAMRAVNQHLAADAAGGRFVTLVYLVIDPVSSGRQLRWISAGQGPLLLFDTTRQQFEELAVHDIPLGVERDWSFQEASRTDWPEQGVLAIGTDGIWEAQNEAGVSFGKEGVMEIIRATAHLPAVEICAAVAARVRAFRGDMPQRDDMTLVVVKFV